jgi:protein involved in polysaccharide export with SLBB domain
LQFPLRVQVWFRMSSRLLSHLHYRFAIPSRLTRLALAFAFVLTSLLAYRANAQEEMNQPANQSGASSSLDANSPSAIAFNGDTDLQDDQESVSSLSNLNASATLTPLSADQIIQILQGNPDLLMEVKNQIADRLQQQGMQVQATDISDDMVFHQISTDAGLRANLSRYLEARGYQPQGAASDTLNATPQDQAITGQRDTTVEGTQNIAASAQDGSAAKTDLAGDRPLQRQTGSSAPTRFEASNTLRGSEEVHASTDLPKVLHQPTPYNLQSMRDLYTQIPNRATPLKRFGSEIFINRAASAVATGVTSVDARLDTPLGPDYILGTGDTLSISLWGGVTQNITRTIDPEGKIMLPEAGVLQIAGLSLNQAEGSIRAALTRQYRDAQVSVTISRLHAVRVYVVGDVQRPGGYDISSLATPLSALYASGGPTSVGSLRVLRHYRGQRMVEEIDLYDFLLHGVQKTGMRFESGDTLQVPPAGPQIAVSGAVKRPAIYELRSGESKLATVIDDAGGLTAAASLGHITIDRIDKNQRRETVTIKDSDGHDAQADQAALKTFTVQDGDRVHIAPILPYSERAIYLQGHVVRPGRLPYVDGMQLSEVLHSYQDLLPEPNAHGEIVRLVPPDLHAETIAFNLPDVLIGNANVSLQPFDTIRVFGRYEFDTPSVTIHGEVLRPGDYPLSQGMSAGQLVRMAGGFKRDALLESADLTSYQIKNDARVESQLAVIRIGAAVKGTDPDADVPLKAGDILTIHQITGWSDIGQSVTIRGQARFPGTYGFQEGERLSSVLRRAGGMLSTAYPEGAVLIREQVRELEEKSRDELIRQIETNSSAARLGPAVGTGDTGGTLQLIKAQQDQALAQLKSHPASGRMVIHISADIDSWANTPYDIELRRGDVLTIPKRPGFVLVNGQVYNATALTYAPGKSASWYLSHAGGTNSTADRKEIFIIRANGSVVGRHSGGWFDPDVLSTKLDPGDVVVVPQKIIGSSLVWRNLLTTAQLASSIAITAGIAASAL